MGNLETTNMQGHRMQRGFTLIELMAVVAIIGVLAALAIPQYQDYVTRSRWSDVITQIAPVKQAIAECLQQTNNVADNCDTLARLQGTAAGTSSGLTVAWIPAASWPNLGTKYGGTAAGNVVTVVTGAGGAPEIQITTDAPALGPCPVHLIADPQLSRVQWQTYVPSTAAATCTRLRTGFDRS
jgi:type IV pilus assembly protein PilA